MNRAAPQRPPMGCLDMIELGARKMTIQTEFFPRPDWRIETKIYLGGALKKVYTDDLIGVVEADLQGRVTAHHEERMKQLVESLKAKSG
ncbi:MAG TPA: hypothetical protein VHL58_14710 [Thermoanaerobaculia bacterium]|nr:hypothetical protein [Thermoanaerobaculia bacterium]